MKPFDPGLMREQVAVQVSSRVRIPGGGSTVTWADVPGWTALWAEELPLKGMEQLRGMQLTASASMRLRMWYLAGLKSTEHRIRRIRDNAILDIIAPPQPDAERATMILLVHETETVAA